MNITPQGQETPNNVPIPHPKNAQKEKELEG